MIVTKIERQKKKERFNVHLDGEYAFAVDGDTLLNFRSLRVGNELSEDELSAIKVESEKRAAYARGFAYLSRSMHTVREVRDKLKKLAYTDGAVDYALNRLATLHLTDDAAYARAYVETHATKGKLRLRHELIAKGVSREVIDDVLSECISEEDELDSATLLAEKFWAQTHDKVKVMRRLLSRGYTYSVIESAISAVKGAEDEEF